MISLLAGFCGGLAWAHDQELFAAAFAVAAVVAGFEARPSTRKSCSNNRSHLIVPIIMRAFFNLCRAKIEKA
jgi:hypothetical protein